MKSGLCNAAAFTSLFLAGTTALGRLKVAENHRYFEDNGKAVVLFGSGIWTIIPDVSVDIEEHNRWYAEWGANANRAALYSFFNAVADGNGIGPWPRTGPGLAHDGKAKFDLAGSNEAFWQRAHRYFESCGRHGIYVWLQIFGEPYVEGGTSRWFINPFNADNHINELPGLPGGRGSGEEAFYDPDNAALMKIQDALVGRLLDETAKRYGNIVYEIGNEINADSVTSKATAWQQHWIDFFRAYERAHGVGLLLSNDTRRSEFEAGASGFQVVNHHAFAPFQVKGNPPWDLARQVNAAVVRDFDRFRRPVVNSRPCSDPDRVNYGDVVSEAEGRCLYWSYFMSGGHVVGFRTTNESWKAGLKAERIIKHLQGFVGRTPFHEMVPSRCVLEGRALCLAAPGTAYALYLPEGGAVTIDLSATDGVLAAQWYNPRTGQWGEEKGVRPGGGVRLGAPDSQDWALYIDRRVGYP